MIEVTLQVRDGRVMRVSSRGHAPGAPAGENILCAGVTVLLRSFARVLEDAPGIESEGEAPHPGSLDMTVLRIDPEKREWFTGISHLLVRGLRDLEIDYPKDLRVFMKERAE